MAARVQIYGTGWCSFSRGFQNYLRSLHIPFEFFDVEKDPAAEEAARLMNGGALKFPMVVVGELEGHWKPGDDARTLKNPRLAELQEALRRYGFTVS
ncbi:MULTISPECIES: glutaredoxin domain-containing protein [unclassified Meiothermus]|uniref:glutaredoxin family protein n=1 Tax=unclassified Meiothermus TaxID=370471 RepID=UPI000D7B9FF9|nr:MULTISPECIES: glutaredoxin domain-containing protein [unclassified Meiothermus]PZA07582.1 NrdH-redoxin [Meiothermus sp. Pnk-1]RYM36798.1 NrdH-redoxin [Meiothermus sp. PNK-Is4]